MERYERTRVLVEGDPSLARGLVKEVEEEFAFPINVLDEPREELVMVKVRETVKGSLFYLGEALMTSCRVRIDSAIGLGLILGSERCRAYELAVIDAVYASKAGAKLQSRWESRLLAERQRLAQREAVQAGRVASTKVDFSTMADEPTTGQTTDTALEQSGSIGSPSRGEGAL